MISEVAERALHGRRLSPDDASLIAAVDGPELPDLFSAATRVRMQFKGSKVSLCSIVNAKSGACTEDCSYCAQSSRSATEIAVYPLVGSDRVLEKAREAKEAGVQRFCIVTSGRKPGKRELRTIGSIIGQLRRIGLLPCATLGLLNRDELSFLNEIGLERYHHNLETSESFFPRVCSTHTYADKKRTIEAAQAVGLSVCSGGIFGLGETWQDRIAMAFALREFDVDSVPINFLIPMKGTPLEERYPLDPFEALKIVSLYRLLLPEKEIRICGGRRQTLGEFNSMVFTAGADSLLTGNYLTTTGTPYGDDLRLIEQHGLLLAGGEPAPA